MKLLKLSILTLFLFVNICSSQSLNLKFLEQISTISFWDIDDVMIDGYGFTKIDVEKKGTRVFRKIANDDINNYINIAIISPDKGSRKILNLLVGPNYSIKIIKNDLIENSYLFDGVTEYGFLGYKKEDVYFLIQKDSDSDGNRQIIMMEKQ